MNHNALFVTINLRRSERKRTIISAPGANISFKKQLDILRERQLQAARLHLHQKEARQRCFQELEHAIVAHQFVRFDLRLKLCDLAVFAARVSRDPSVSVAIDLRNWILDTASLPSKKNRDASDVGVMLWKFCNAQKNSHVFGHCFFCLPTTSSQCYDGPWTCLRVTNQFPRRAGARQRKKRTGSVGETRPIFPVSPPVQRDSRSTVCQKGAVTGIRILNQRCLSSLRLLPVGQVGGSGQRPPPSLERLAAASASDTWLDVVAPDRSVQRARREHHHAAVGQTQDDVPDRPQHPLTEQLHEAGSCHNTPSCTSRQKHLQAEERRKIQHVLKRGGWPRQQRTSAGPSHAASIHVPEPPWAHRRKSPFACTRERSTNDSTSRISSAQNKHGHQGAS